MGVFEFRVGRKKPTPGEVAKERLKVLLVHDRLKLTPELLEVIKGEILSVLSQRLEVDEEQMQVSLERDNGADLLQTNIPVKRQKVSFDWDPPSYTPSSEPVRGTVTIENSEEE
jgi:cell division topological specificity factor